MKRPTRLFYTKENTNDLSLGGWHISLTTLPSGPDRRQLYSPCDYLFECPTADLACLVYSVEEVRMGWMVGLLAILQQKAQPSIVLCSQHFRCFFTRESVNYSNNGQFVFVKTYWHLLDPEKSVVTVVALPLTIFDVMRHRFACIVLENSLPYRVKELNQEVFQLVEMYRDERFSSRDGYLIHLPKVVWHDFSDIENYQEIYRIQRGS